MENNEPKQLEEYKITSIKDFIDLEPEEESVLGATRTVYRGIGSEKRHKLEPSFFRLKRRPLSSMSWLRYEQEILNSFMKQASPFLQSPPSDILECMALAQHHGVPTRLLDWTESFLTALFFAVNEEKFVNVNGVVWALEGFVYNDNPVDTVVELNNIVSRRKNNIYYPKHITPRISAQQGCFTIHSTIEDNKKSPPLEDMVKSGEKSAFLTKYIIPHKFKKSIRQELDLLGVNDFTIFPDLDGLARKLKWHMHNAKGTHLDTWD